MAPSQQAMEQVTSSDVDASPSAPPPALEAVESVPANSPSEPPPSAPPAKGVTETPLAFAAKEPLPLPAREDSSFPPVDLDSHFFDATTTETDESHERDPRMVLKLGPEAARRRAQFQKYVKIAVAAASVLCLAALVKGALTRNHEEPAVRRASAAVVAPAPAPQPVQTAAPALEEVPAPPEQPAAAAEPQATAPAVAATETASAAPAAAPTEQAAPAPAPSAAEGEAAPTATDTAEAPAPDPKEAAKAKRASQAALERGKIAAAIEAGEQSVSLDPTDAEAWLILGAAYQEKGDQKNARRSFKSCLEQGKRGPRWECAQMPH